jgi:RimJ/RimL family protein N-acetyltransferase
MYKLETPRLYLREMNVSDASDIYHLNLDPQVIKYTGDVAFDSIADAKRFIETYDHYEKYGFGRWAMISKSDHAFIGWCGIKYSPSIGEYDIGYRLMKKYWGQNYATEAASACIDWAFAKLDISTIIGRSVEENIASCRVLEKIGLRYVKTIKENNDMLKIYQISNTKIKHNDKA